MSTSPPAEKFPWTEQTYRGKHALDLVGAVVGLVLTSPLILLIALAVKLTSPGPVFYRGVRAGLCAREFRQLKFRSMVPDSGGGAFTTRSDPRITCVGRMLRFLKLDELPQLVNVLRGEMSIVGPRPEDAASVKALYNSEQLRVLSVRPGLTCMTQIRVFPDFTYDIPDGVEHDHYYRTTIVPARLQEDLQYIDRMSLWVDIKIIGQTLYCLLVKSWFIFWRRRVAHRAGGQLNHS